MRARNALRGAGKEKVERARCITHLPSSPLRLALTLPGGSMSSFRSGLAASGNGCPSLSLPEDFFLTATFRRWTRGLPGASPPKRFRTSFGAEEIGWSLAGHCRPRYRRSDNELLSVLTSCYCECLDVSLIIVRCETSVRKEDSRTCVLSSATLIVCYTVGNNLQLLVLTVPYIQRCDCRNLYCETSSGA